MNEQDLRRLIADVKEGAVSRRSFIKRMAAVGLAAPIAGQLLAWNDVAWANATLEYKPTKAGGGGPLKILLWQAPTLLNPHFASGTKDQIASRIFYEPLAVAIDRQAPLDPAGLVDEVSRIVDEMHSDGTLTELSMKWYGEDFSQSTV